MGYLKLPGILAGSILLSVPVARADGGDASVIHACVHKASAHVRIVNANQHCHHSESPLHWPAQASTGSAGPRGVRLFESDGSFTVPAGVTSVLVEMWGGGGAAGLPNITGIGGAGGGGGYLRTVVAVTPGQAIQVVVGAGGAAACGVDGGAGGDTTFGALAMAGGGQGGSAAGQPGAGGVSDPTGISVPGTIGFATGGFSAQGSFAPPAGRPPGRGGFSFTGCPGPVPIDGALGRSGQMIVQW